MKYLLIFAVIVVLVLIFLILHSVVPNKNGIAIQNSREIFNNENNITNMKLTSLAFEDGGMIPSKYTCDGESISPPLAISNVPSETKSLVLILEDPDVPKNIRPDGIWDHLIVFNIPPDQSEIKEGQTIKGVYGSGTSGATKYMPPCPPDREHRYIFYLYALDSTPPLQAGATKKEVLDAMAGHIISQTTLIGRYDRKK